MTEMLKKLLIETNYEVTEFQRRFHGECDSPASVNMLFSWCSCGSQTCRQEKGIRGYRAIALMSVMAKLFSFVVVLMLNNIQRTDGLEKAAPWSRRRCAL